MPGVTSSFMTKETNSVNIKEYLNVPRGYVASNDYEYYADKISETFIAEEDRKACFSRGTGNMGKP